MELAKIFSLGLAGFLGGLWLQDWGARPPLAVMFPGVSAANQQSVASGSAQDVSAPSASAPNTSSRPGAPASNVRTSNASARKASVIAAGAAKEGAERSLAIPSTLLLAPRMPAEWLPARGRECIRRGKYKGVCQGPRRVPKPIGAEAGLAAELGLGEARAVGRLLSKPPKHAWRLAAGTHEDEVPVWPVTNGRLHRGLLAARDGKRAHRGLDIAAPEGSPIRAIKSGIVAYSNNEVAGYGNLLVVVHPDGSVAFYGHCRSIYVFPGQRVKRGEIVGEVGRTGRATGPHVHFEYRTAGCIRNSLPLFGDQVPGRRRRG